ncbi:MAG: hypothetical protein CMH31_06995 [Micavibrio sp.]|nr:hypothetical protein [Micavibrio sp.]
MIDQINNILFWTCLFVLLWNAYFLLFNKGVPNLRSSKAIRAQVVEKFIDEAKILNKDSMIIYDIGCGYGHITRDMARALPQAIIIGIEINIISYTRAILTSKILGIKNTRYIRKNFHDVDLSDADGLYMFLLGSLMEQIRGKLEKDLKKGTLIISNKFQINGKWKPIKTLNINTLAPSQKTVYIYRK